MDAIFQPRPHGAIAVDPLATSPYEFSEDVNYLLSEPRRSKVKRGGRQPIVRTLPNRAAIKAHPRGKKDIGFATNRSPRAMMSGNQALRRMPSFFSCRRSLAASATNQSRNVTILGSVVVAFGQMIQ